MSDYIGEASVKITGDIKPLEEAVNKAEAMVRDLQSQDLQGFKITYDDQSFESMEQYTAYINEQQAEWEKYTEAKASSIEVENELASAFNNTEQSVQNLSDTYSQASDAISSGSQTMQATTVGFVEDFKDRLVMAKDYAEGFVLRIKGAFEKKISTDRGVLALAVSAVAAFKKCMDATREVDSTMDKAMTSISESFEKIEVGIGRLVEPIVTLLAPAFQLLGAVIEAVTTPLKWLADGINNVFSAIGGLLGIQQQSYSLTEQQLWQIEQLKALDEQLASNTKELDEAYKNMNSTLESTNEIMANAWDSYSQGMKRILVEHENTMAKLTMQVEEANRDYKKAIEERNANFILSQAKEEKAHQEKVEELMTQLNFLQRYNNAYNKEKLEAVKFAIAREEALYKKQTEAQKAELDLQNEYDKQKRDERIANYNKELADEQAFLEKHAQAFRDIREVMLRDEVENLQKSYNQQVANAQKTRNSVMAEYNELANQMNSRNEILNIAERIYQRWSSISSTIKTARWNYQEFANINQRIIDSLPSDDKLRKVAELVQAASYGGSLWTRGYADGGFTGRGGENEIAGVVHKGEYVLPQEYVDQSTGTPKNIGGNITVNVSGTFATSESERRKVAQQIVEAIKQTTYSRLGA